MDGCAVSTHPSRAVARPRCVRSLTLLYTPALWKCRATLGIKPALFRHDGPGNG
jgi:hypothetical protein